MTTKKLTAKETGRFAMIPHSFIEDSKGMSFHSRWLYVALVYYRNSGNGKAFPSYDTIRNLTGLRKEKISKGIKELVENGWLEKERRFSRSNLYEIHFSKFNEKSLEEPKVQTEIDNNDFQLEQSIEEARRYYEFFGRRKPSC